MSSSEMDAEDASGLPRLEYNIWDHKTKLFIVTGLLIIEASVLPIALYYPLWYDTTLQHAILFAIITSFFGIVTGLEFAHRSWRLLLLRADTYRPPGGGRWAADATHWTLSFGYTLMTALLVGASIPYEPLVRPLALPVPLFALQLGLQLFVTGVAHARGWRAPFRISSCAKGESMRPFVFTAVEDVVGVDGGGGKAYRQRLLARYEASACFRRLIAGLNWFWGVGALLDGAGTVAAVFAIPSEEVAYGVGWASPLIFVCVWTAVTIYWVKRSLRIEKRLWATDAAC